MVLHENHHPEKLITANLIFMTKLTLNLKIQSRVESYCQFSQKVSQAIHCYRRLHSKETPKIKY